MVLLHEDDNHPIKDKKSGRQAGRPGRQARQAGRQADKHLRCLADCSIPGSIG